jgi:hypothetical protein
MDLLSLLPKQESGFTLLETVLYLALFGLVIGNATLLGHAVTQNIEKQVGKLETQEHAGFVVDKIKWLLDNNAVVSPGPGDVSPKLILTGDSGRNEVGELSGRLQIQKNSAPPVFLTPTGDEIKNFTARQDSNNELIIEFQLNGQVFSFSKQIIAEP